MLNRKWYTILLVCSVLHMSARGGELLTPSDELEVCSSNAPECQEVSCLDQCLLEGEDPLNCPEYCNSQAQNNWKRRLAKY